MIEIHVTELRQLFNAIDPSPFRGKDLDPKAEEFIVSWAKEAPRDTALALLVHLDRPAGHTDEPAALRDAVRQFFRSEAAASRGRLRQMFRIGRVSLLIGIVCLTLSFVVASLVEDALGGRRLGELLREGVLIGGWVAMWRPLEIFLYDWWPVQAEARLFDRLSAMPVQIAYAGTDLDASSSFIMSPVGGAGH